MKTLKHNILGLLVTTGIMVNAQTSNYGEITILPNTQMSIVDNFNNTNNGELMNDGELFVYSNFNNNGLVSYFNIDDNGTTRFKGTKAQQITGNEIIQFNNLALNNTTPGTEAISLNDIITIDSEADFTEGIIKNGNSGQIIFNNDAIAINTNNKSFVDGTVYKRGDKAFNFPVGDSIYYRKAAISAPISESAQFTSRYYLEDPDTNFPRTNKSGVIEVVNDTEYWVIQNESNTTEDVFITLSWDDAVTSPAILAGSESAIHVLRWNSTDRIWEELGGAVDAAENSVTTIATISNFGIFTLGRVNENALLPLGGVVYNAISANNDGKNDYLRIDELEKYKDNKIEIFNRWGVKVFSTTNYGSNGNVFRGVSSTQSQNSDNYLPTGTYFYSLTLNYTENNTNKSFKKSGYLYISSD